MKRDEKKLFECKDKNGYTVQLLFQRNGFPHEAEHVLVLTTYKGKWLLTKHSKRGFEFPGGKVEIGENVEDAAIREVYEETGGIVEHVKSIGEYYVHDPIHPFVKAVFTAEVKEIEDKADYFETDGPILFNENLLEQLHKEMFSFIMRDEVMEQLITFVQNNR